jgi:Signal peptidase subunit
MLDQRRLVTAQEEAALEGKDLDEFHPYVVNDQGFHLRGRPFNLTVSWNVMPLVGATELSKHHLLASLMGKHYITCCGMTDRHACNAGALRTRSKTFSGEPAVAVVHAHDHLHAHTAATLPVTAMCWSCQQFDQCVASHLLQGSSFRRSTLRHPAPGRGPAGAVPSHSRCCKHHHQSLPGKWQLA